MATGPANDDKFFNIFDLISDSVGASQQESVEILKDIRSMLTRVLNEHEEKVERLKLMRKEKISLEEKISAFHLDYADGNIRNYCGCRPSGPSSPPETIYFHGKSMCRDASLHYDTKLGQTFNVGKGEFTQQNKGSEEDNQRSTPRARPPLEDGRRPAKLVRKSNCSLNTIEHSARKLLIESLNKSNSKLSPLIDDSATEALEESNKPHEETYSYSYLCRMMRNVLVNYYNRSEVSQSDFSDTFNSAEERYIKGSLSAPELNANYTFKAVEDRYNLAPISSVLNFNEPPVSRDTRGPRILGLHRDTNRNDMAIAYQYNVTPPSYQENYNEEPAPFVRNSGRSKSLWGHRAPTFNRMLVEPIPEKEDVMEEPKEEDEDEESPMPLQKKVSSWFRRSFKRRSGKFKLLNNDQK